MSLQRVNLNGQNLKLNGYYYHKGGEADLFTTYFFYKNGVALYGGTVNEADIDLFNSENSWNGVELKDKTNWGLIQVKEDSIVIEKWGATSGFALKTVLYYGKILNDTTFMMKEYKSNYGGGIQAIKDTFHFHSFSPKPDSTNTFIQ